MELIIMIAVLVVLAYLSFKLAGCVLALVRIALTIWIFWLLYTYIIVPLWM
ncbi:MAG: hypothetical protein KIG60_04670 [Caryophanon sp.]|nr:hypothetical protein [Caryophanon sp.]